MLQQTIASRDKPKVIKPVSKVENLEMLLVEKVQRGEDVTGTIQALEYFQSSSNDQYCHKMYYSQTKERQTFESVQRVIITAFAILGMIVFLAKVHNPSANLLNQLPPLSIQK
jgi:hypothetical protein